MQRILQRELDKPDLLFGCGCMRACLCACERVIICGHLSSVFFFFLVLRISQLFAKQTSSQNHAHTTTEGISIGINYEKLLGII